VKVFESQELRKHTPETGHYNRTVLAAMQAIKCLAMNFPNHSFINCTALAI
jgi:hypothetical protein